MSEGPPTADVFAATRDHLIRRTAGIQKLTGAGAFAVRAQGAEVQLSDGRRLLDLGTWAATVLGHRPPAVVAAVGDQLGALPAAPRGLANPGTPLLARRLAGLARPSRLDKVWLGANGADAAETALKLARLATGRMRVLAVAGGFHGRTLAALAASDADRCRPRLAPLLRGVTICEPRPGELERELARGDAAAVIFEIVPGSSPALPLPSELLLSWERAAHEHGALVIVDEIQTGLWRCGAFCLSLSLGLAPDAILLGKTLGGGVMPLSALLYTAAMGAGLEDDPWLVSQTFSGHPLSCAAGLAALDAAAAAAAEDYDRVAGWLRTLRARLAGHPQLITDVGVCGLMMGVRFVSARAADQFVLAAAQAGVLVAPSDGDRSVIRILAPLVLREAEMAAVAEALDRACRKERPPLGTTGGGGQPAGTAVSAGQPGHRPASAGTA